MRALQVHELLPDHAGVALADLPVPQPGPGEVLIGVDNTNGVQTPLCEYVGEDGGDGI